MVQADRLLTRLLEKYPSDDETHLTAIAAVWTVERDRIIERMLDICRDEIGPVLPAQARSEAIFELAKLTIWLEDKIIEKKTDNVSITRIDSNQEYIALETQLIKERIENTARICADHIWKRFLERWHKQYPLIVSSDEKRISKSRVLLPEDNISGVKKQHYSPVFSNKYWASPPKNEVRVYFRGVNHQVSSKDRGYRTWGQEAFIYSQQLEQRFQVIEGDAKTAYDKLINTIPLNDNDRLFWIAFLASQIFRTPSFILKHLSQLKRFVEESDLNFPPNTINLRRAYEYLFEDNRVFDGFYRQVTAYQWELWRLSPEMQFIRSDDPVVICGSPKLGTWQLIYPMTPHHCFVVGPNKVGTTNNLIPTTRKIDEGQLQTINGIIAERARKSVIGKSTIDDSQLLILLDKTLCTASTSSNWQTKLFPEFWGPIVK